MLIFLPTLFRALQLLGGSPGRHPKVIAPFPSLPRLPECGRLWSSFDTRFPTAAQATPRAGKPRLVQRQAWGGGAAAPGGLGGSPS